MKNVINNRSSISRREQPVLLYNQRLLDIPVNFVDVTGVLLYRDSDCTVSYFDGMHWRRLNRAGWAIQFDCQFPHDLPPNHWGIYSPIKKRRSNYHYHDLITAADLTWALSIPEAPIDERDERGVEQTEWASSEAFA